MPFNSSLQKSWRHTVSSFSPSGNLSAAIMWTVSRLLGFPPPFVFSAIHFFLLLRCIAVGESTGPGRLNRPFNNSISSILVFGDSTVDPGNNNYVDTLFRSNFPPYGRSFAGGAPTGRFTDGRLVTDFIASHAGIKQYVPPYLDPRLGMEELMTGVSFASAGSGFDPLTAQLSNVIPIGRQVEYLREYRAKLEESMGKERTNAVMKKAVFVVSAGTNDFVINYFGTPFRRQSYDLNAYQEFLLQQTRQFIQKLRNEGARVIALVGLPPIGCLPIVITFTTALLSGNRRCNIALSKVAMDYNHKLQNMVASLQKTTTSIIVYADIYKPINDIIQNASQFGFDTANAGCCGCGLVEASILCNPGLPVCPNPSKYVFFDSVHPTEETYKQIFQSLRPTINHVIKNC